MSVVPTCPHGKAMVRKRDLRTERGWQALDPLIRAQTGIVSWSGSRRDGDPTRCCFCHNSSFTPLNSRDIRRGNRWRALLRGPTAQRPPQRTRMRTSCVSGGGASRGKPATPWSKVVRTSSLYLPGPGVQRKS